MVPLLKDNMRESIKLLLNSGVSIRKSYKSKINDWYGEFELYRVYDYYTKKDKYYAWHKEFTDIDEAVEFFMVTCLTSKNKGYIQQRLDKKLNIEDYDLENPSEDLIQIFEEEGKIVDEEFKYL